MKFTKTRKALALIAGVKLRADIERTLGVTERAAKKDAGAAGKRTSHLIAMLLALEGSIPAKARRHIVEAIFQDTVKTELPHQWERKPDYECEPLNDCGKPAQDKICYRDTWTGACVSG